PGVHGGRAPARRWRPLRPVACRGGAAHPRVHPARWHQRDLARNRRARNGIAMSCSNTEPAASHWNTEPAASHWNTEPAASHWNTEPAASHWDTEPAASHWDTEPAAAAAAMAERVGRTGAHPAT